MSDQESYKPSVLILPHWRIEGGAGFYIRDLINLLKSRGRISVAGRFANEYAGETVRSSLLNKLAALSLPAYDGIRWGASLYHALKSFLYFLYVWVGSQQCQGSVRPSTLIFTSSVQAMGVPLARRIFPDSRIVVVVQESVNLSQGFGRLTAVFLRQCDLVISITESWANHAINYGINSVILPNAFSPSFAEPEYNTETPVESDLLYVGGGATIKGFDNFKAALPSLLKKSGRKIVCLGYYGRNELRALERIRDDSVESDAQLSIVGLVSDIRPYLRGTKLLLLPIGSPHFCRPAIEAGLFGKPFIVTDLPGLSDFAKPNINCFVIEQSNVRDLVKMVNKLLDDHLERQNIGAQNLKLARTFLESGYRSHSILNVIFSGNPKRSGK